MGTVFHFYNRFKAGAWKNFFLLFLLVWLWPVRGTGQKIRTADGKRVSEAVIPFTEKWGLPVVEVTVNGRTYDFIFDTGASRMCVSEKVVREAGLIITGETTVRDVNGVSSRQGLAVIPGVSVGGLTTGYTDAVVIKEDNYILRCLGVDGLIGSGFSRRHIMRINTRDSVITVNRRLPGRKSGSWARMSHTRGNCPHVEVSFVGSMTGEKVKGRTLLDTGSASGRFGLPPAYSSALFPAIMDRLEVSYGTSSRGINGLGRSGEIYRAIVPVVTVGGVDIPQVPVRSAAKANIGFKLLEYGEIVLDFPRNRYTFIPFGCEIEWPASVPAVESAVVDGRVVVMAVWSPAIAQWLEYGDRIVSIGTEKLDSPDPCYTPSILNLLRTRATSSQDIVAIEKAGGHIIEVPVSEFFRETDPHDNDTEVTDREP